MSVTGIQHGYMWARHFKGAYSYSVTVQVQSRDATCEVALNSAWISEPPHDACDAMITQIVSASGVEEFPSENIYNEHLVSVVSRSKVTSVTFKVHEHWSKAMARWMIYLWD